MVLGLSVTFFPAAVRQVHLDTRQIHLQHPNNSVQLLQQLAVLWYARAAVLYSPEGLFYLTSKNSPHKSILFFPNLFVMVLLCHSSGFGCFVCDT